MLTKEVNIVSRSQQFYFSAQSLDRNRDRKMCFYGRVSTQHEAQLDALGNQMQWYDDQLRYHPNWTVIDRYIDEGITGTLAKKRPSFMRMIEDAKEQKFDLIVTREVCRFARNTVDTLVITRELKNLGVEVYFVEDNIWTLDNDGELRLTIMATLAQEESRKISERVRAGQQVSRENGSLYGNGNIIGYDRDNLHHTYVINPEQAETIRMVFNLYAQGLGEKAVVNELCRLRRKDGYGNINWSCVKISRILRNATYMGYICYNKSRVNNFLEKKRIKNLDESTYIYVKGDFEPIVSEELWRECERIRKGRIAEYRLPSGEVRRAGTQQPRNLWSQKLRCRCGASYKRYRWRVLKDGSPVYGYQCTKRTVNPSVSFVKKHHLTKQLACDAISIPEWKLELMAKCIFQQVWGDQNAAVRNACLMLESCQNGLDKRSFQNISAIQAKIDKAKRRKMNFAKMYADGDLEREEYRTMVKEAEAELHQLERELTQETTEPKEENGVHLDMKQIQKALAKIVDTSEPKIAPEVIDEFVEVITPVSDYSYRWKLCLGPKVEYADRADMMQTEDKPVLSFTIDFETAKAFRQENRLPAQFRRAAWTDLQVEVYL